MLNRVVSQSFLFCSIILLLASCNDKSLGKFVKLSKDETGITFTNQIFENDSINIFDFANIYNGGGVGVGDFNNDGLQDLYFTGNMVPNKLYLNKGDLKFQDITKESQTDGKGIWSRGVAVVDINNDGNMDMYVCATAKRNPLKRINILYVNQGMDKNGIPVFKDMANEYGLADTTQSTMAYFFDYDNDGDLDLYIGVNHIGKDEYTNTFRNRKINGEHSSTGRLYRNDWNDSLKHPFYTDVSRQAGILIEGFTHAVDIFDINNDGWQDILVLNDYISSNVLYINNHDGTFTDRSMDYFKHTAANSMGSDAVDINNDGLDDVIEVDMSPEDNYRKKMFQSPNSYFNYQNSDKYGYQYQYVRNMIQLNMGPSMGQMDSIKHPVFADIGFYCGIAETDWSWTPLVADFDNDGNKDILFTNGFPKDVTDHDFIVFKSSATRLISKKDMLDEIPAVRIHKYIYKNNGNLTFTNKTNEWGLEEASFSNGAAYADLDNDGDLDVVINNIDDPAMIYENRIVNKIEKKNFIDIKFKGPAGNINGVGAKVIVHQKDSIQTFLNNPYRGYISSVSSVMHFGLGNSGLDSIEVIWPGNSRQVIPNPSINATLQIDIKNAVSIRRPVISPLAKDNWFTNITSASGIDYVHQQRDFIDFNIQRLLPHKFSQYSPGIAAGDINGDHLDDFIIGGAPGFSPMVFIQKSNGQFTTHALLGQEQVPLKRSDDRSLLLFDADGDNDLDLYISAGGYAYDPGDSGYTDVLYINNGQGIFTEAESALPVNTGSKFCVRACDYDKDGDLDLFIAGRVEPHNYPKPVSSFIYRNDSKDGKIVFTDVTDAVASPLKNIGLTCDALFTDFNNDGWPDIVLVGEWMPVRYFKNEQGKFKDVTNETGISDKVGWYNSITSGDFDNDGDIDYVVGNLGENSFYKGNEKYSVSVYAKDFDGNGIMECVPTKFILDTTDGQLKEFPAQTRDDVVDHMPFIKKRFLSYRSFARATINDLFTPEQFKGIMKFSANYFKSSFIRNNGNSKFSIEPLPDIAQFSVINGMIAEDFDGDGNLDICMNTNDFSTEPGNGRYDALNGLILKGKGDGHFIPLSIVESGIFISGNGKGLSKLKAADGSLLLAATQNMGPVEIYKQKQRSKIIEAAAGDAFAILTFNDGKKQKVEFNYGSSFLSQSPRYFLLSSKVTNCDITDQNGKTRNIPIKNL
ncbi:MAG TPA: VCBS repeat-containing protein [Chitinophagaceae bacterium]|nr:VCBS repeat-containing protein [Chitinophagaceae bacterium]